MVSKTISPAFMGGATALLLLCLMSGISGDKYCNKMEKYVQSMTLINKINSYRRQNGLHSLKPIQTLCYVAQKHVSDLTENAKSMSFDGNCNMHSWGLYNTENTTPAKSCCYTSDHANGACVWKKPKEFDSDWRHGNGYEISAWHSAKMTTNRAMSQWKGSSGHNNQILQRGGWANSEINHIGAAVEGKFAVVWFSE